MQQYVEIPDTHTLQQSLVELLGNDKTAISCSSGTAFPTVSTQVGMLCLRTDQLKLYQLKDNTPTWVLIADLSRIPAFTDNPIFSGLLSLSDATVQLGQVGTVGGGHAQMTGAGNVSVSGKGSVSICWNATTSDGTVWNRQDTSAASLRLRLSATGMEMLTATAGANPIAWTAPVKVATLDANGKLTADTTGNAANVTGTVAVANGGTGANTLTGIVKGNGTGPMTAAAAGTDFAAPGATTTFSKGQRGAILPLTDAATIAVDFDTSNNFSVTLAGSHILGNPTNAAPGQSGSIFIGQGAGGFALSYASNWKFASGLAPTNSLSAGAKDRLDYIVESATVIHAQLKRDVK